jgi:hypothetical protein
MRRVILLALVVMCGGCEASEQEKDQANRAWISCLTDAALRYDDHKSSVVDVAYGILPACSTQFHAVEEAYGSALSIDAYYGSFQPAMERKALQTATAVILKERASR